MGLLPLALAQTSSDAAAAGGALALGGIMIVIWLVVVFGGLALFLWALIDAIRRQFPGDNDKIIWILVIVLIGWIGPIVYLIVGRKKGTIPGQSAPTPPSEPVEPSK